MNALAQLAINNDYKVTGSDRSYNKNDSPYKELEKNGVKIYPQNGKSINSTIDFIIYSTAIEKNNPDLEKARELNIDTLHRIDFLKILIPDDAEIIAITGTAGKTTTTGLLAWIFESAGLNPTVYNGASLINWKKEDSLGNIRVGNNKLWILEADESDRSLLKLNPTHTLLTNIGNDHLSEKILIETFNKFKNQTKEIFQKGILNQFNNFNINHNLIGKHNKDNALYALSFSYRYGIDIKTTLKAIKSFKGIERRLEFIGYTKNKIKIYDDYAHNSMKIDATLNALSDKNHNYGTHAFWRPHGHSSFNNSFLELIDVFSRFLDNKKNTLSLLPIYYAGGTVKTKYTSEDLLDQINLSNTFYANGYEELGKIISSKKFLGDILVGMGARDPNISKFLKSLKSENL